MKKNKGKIALASARSAIERARDVEPPNVYIEKAREIFGPEIFRMRKKGWIDEDIIALFSDQNESDMRQLLEEARRAERRASREQKERAQQKRDRASSAQRANSSVASPSTADRIGGSSPMLTIEAPAPRPSLALPSPSAPEHQSNQQTSGPAASPQTPNRQVAPASPPRCRNRRGTPQPRRRLAETRHDATEDYP